MQDHTASSIKSLEGFDVAWIEEAQSLSQRSLDLLRPTIREEGSEIWASWNPDKDTDPIDVLLRKDNPPDAIVIESSYLDNPFFPDVLRREMEWDKRRDYEKYEHVWLGGYQQHSEARVFKNWTIEEFERPAGTIHRLGADWGFSIDPSVLVRCSIDGAGDALGVSLTSVPASDLVFGPNGLPEGAVVDRAFVVGDRLLLQRGAGDRHRVFGRGGALGEDAFLVDLSVGYVAHRVTCTSTDCSCLA
jgi:hypothetical protein